MIEAPLAKQPGTGGEKMHVDQDEGLPAKTRWRTDRPRRQSRRLGRAAAADRPHAPAARAHGGDRSSDRRRRQIWRCRGLPDRRDQPQAASPCAAAEDRCAGRRDDRPDRRASRRISPKAWRRWGSSRWPATCCRSTSRTRRNSPEVKAAARRRRRQVAAPRAQGRAPSRGQPRATRGQAQVNRLAIFDCDGTLVDSGATIHRALSEAFTMHHGLECPPPERRAAGDRPEPGRSDGRACARRRPCGASPTVRNLQVMLLRGAPGGPGRGAVVRRHCRSCSTRWRPTAGCLRSRPASRDRGLRHLP